MKRQKRIVGFLSALAVILAAVGTLCGAVYSEAIDSTLYGEKSRQAVAEAYDLADDEAVTAYIGMDEQRQSEAAKLIALYMELGNENTQLGLDELNEKEISHMADVRRLIAGFGKMRTLGVTLAAGLTVVLAWVGAGLEKRHRPVIIGAVCGIGVLALVGAIGFALMNLSGFETLFVGIHKLLFTNENWLLNPATDILIRMMPQTLFERAFSDVLGQFARAFVLALVLMAAVYAVVSGMICRQLTEEKKA